MITTGNIKEVREIIKKTKAEGKTVSLVPTMGFLHIGHISLLRKAKEESDFTVLTIFINPTQFGENEDFSSYPKSIDSDLSIAKKENIDLVFTPTMEDMYPEGYKTYVEVEGLGEKLCGEKRQGHFRGVATIVLKLFNIVTPNIAIFGLKDFQQFQIISKMTKDLNLDIDIIGMETVREEGGLALSSRNSYLNVDERKAALIMPSTIKKAQELFKNGEKNTGNIIKTLREEIKKEPLARIEYLKITNIDNFEEIETIDNVALFAACIHIGKTRLIDNLILK